MRDFLRIRADVTGGNSLAFVRVANLGYPTHKNWVDERDNTELVWDGDKSSVGGNAGIESYSFNDHAHGYIGKFQFHLYRPFTHIS